MIPDSLQLLSMGFYMEIGELPYLLQFKVNKKKYGQMKEEKVKIYFYINRKHINLYILKKKLSYL